MTLVHSSFRTGNSVSEASLFTNSISVGGGNSWADRISIVELRAAMNAAISSNSTINFTYFSLVVKLILSASSAICETIYRPFLI